MQEFSFKKYIFWPLAGFSILLSVAVVVEILYPGTVTPTDKNAVSAQPVVLSATGITSNSEQPWHCANFTSDKNILDEAANITRSAGQYFMLLADVSQPVESRKKFYETLIGLFENPDSNTVEIISSKTNPEKISISVREYFLRFLTQKSSNYEIRWYINLDQSSFIRDGEGGRCEVAFNQKYQRYDNANGQLIYEDVTSKIAVLPVAKAGLCVDSAGNHYKADCCTIKLGNITAGKILDNDQPLKN